MPRQGIPVRAKMSHPMTFLAAKPFNLFVCVDQLQAVLERGTPEQILALTFLIDRKIVAAGLQRPELAGALKHLDLDGTRFGAAIDDRAVDAGIELLAAADDEVLALFRRLLPKRWVDRLDELTQLCTQLPNDPLRAEVRSWLEDLGPSILENPACPAGEIGLLALLTTCWKPRNSTLNLDHYVKLLEVISGNIEKSLIADFLNPPLLPSILCRCLDCLTATDG